MRTCKKCEQQKPLEQFPWNGRGYRKHTCRDCWNAAQRVAQRKHYQNGGKAYVYQWYEARGGQAVYWKRQAMKRRLGK